MRTKTMYQIVSVVILAAVFLATSATAEEIVIKGQNIQQKAEVTMHSQSKDKKTGSGTYRNQGLTLLDNGGVAPYVNQGAFTYGKHGSHHSGFTVRTYPDGSTITTHYTGKARKGTPPLKREFEGTGKVIGGTGRFEGATGTATYKGGRYANGMSKTDLEFRIKLAQ